LKGKKPREEWNKTDDGGETAWTGERALFVLRKSLDKKDGLTMHRAADNDGGALV